MEASSDSDAIRSAQPSSSAQKDLVWPVRYSAAWLFAWTGLALWAAYGLATRWPYEMHPLLILFVLAVPGVAFRTVDILIMRQSRRRLGGWRRAGGRLAVLPLGLFLAMVLFAQLDRMSMERFEREISPWVAEIQAGSPVACPADGRYPVKAALNAYIEHSGGLRRVTLHQGRGHFVLELAGRSIDIDGSTVFYDSAIQKWSKFHNDSRERSDAFQALVEPLERCQFILS